MSTCLGVINDNVSVTRFYGGDDRGVCAQLTGDDGFIHLTASEIIAVLPMLKNVIDMELGRKKTHCETAIRENKELSKTIVKDMREVSSMAISQSVMDFAALMVLGKAAVTDSEVVE